MIGLKHTMKIRRVQWWTLFSFLYSAVVAKVNIIINGFFVIVCLLLFEEFL